jgi:hypothetical protein
VHAKDEAGLEGGTMALRAAVRMGGAGDPVVSSPLVLGRVGGTAGATT